MPTRLRRLEPAKVLLAAGLLAAGLAVTYRAGDEPSPSGQDQGTMTAASTAKSTGDR